MTDSDKTIIEHCLDGKPDEFGRLVRRYQTALAAYLTSQLGDQTRVEEAAQETFVRAYFGLKDLAKRESFSSWLFGIARRVAKEQARNKVQYLDPGSLVEWQMPDETHCPDFELQRAFAQLSDRCREIVLLRFYASQSCQQIAENLNMPLGSVTKTLSRAYSHLRQLLEKQENERMRCKDELR